MPVRVTLRTGPFASPFRKHLASLMESPFGDSLVLCSGYIWETDSASSGYKVLDDLLAHIVRGCASGTLTTVAGKLGYGDYVRYYRNFVRRIRGAGVRVQPLIAPKRNWHAKIAIRMSQTSPRAAIVGS